MIGQMTRKAAFFNPMVSKSAGAGTNLSWDELFEVWCKYDRGDGSISGNGSQQNLIYNTIITVRHSNDIATYLNKDTKIKVNGVEHQVVDFRMINDKEKFFQIRAVAKEKGTTAETTSNMKSVLHTVTADEVTAGYFIETDTKNRTIISIETQRDMVATIITEGEPTGAEIKYTAASAKYEVAEDAPLVVGEKFRILYK